MKESANGSRHLRRYTILANDSICVIVLELHLQLQGKRFVQFDEYSPRKSGTYCLRKWSLFFMNTIFSDLKFQWRVNTFFDGGLKLQGFEI